MIVELYFSGVLIAVDLLDHKVENVNSALGQRVEVLATEVLPALWVVMAFVLDVGFHHCDARKVVFHKFLEVHLEVTLQQLTVDSNQL